ncbi:hypothetical protein [Desulfosporosinus sp. BG]|uniref:hypothetical protein n=1 Tax=Desulfosporosinus sp. BG TaxID=1633135 RepID=UPI00083B1C78|nr:hypothetical protein [Desulfosporosinus sp. BG]
MKNVQEDNCKEKKNKKEESCDKRHNSSTRPLKTIEQLLTLLLVISLMIGWIGIYLFALSLTWQYFSVSISYALAGLITIIFGLLNVKLYNLIFLL